MYSIEYDCDVQKKDQFIYVLVQEKDLQDFLFLTFTSWKNK